MIDQELVRAIEEVCSGDLSVNEPLAKHCSFRTGGPADLFVKVRTADQLQQVMQQLQDAQVPVFLLGRGTNLLIGDGGYRGAIVTMAGENTASEQSLCGIEVNGTEMKAGAGATLGKIALTAKEHGLTGLEFAAGIPGSVGGGIMMNAGAYGGELKQVVREVCILTPEGEFVTKSAQEMAFGYRTSILKHEPGTVVSATFDLTEGDPAQIAARMEDLARQRMDKQPLEYPSAGSTFKRPEGYFAGKLIMDAGLRGYRVGDAQVSEKHCGFVINRGSATAAQIRTLIDDVQKVVFEKYGVSLETEVIMLGEF